MSAILVLFIAIGLLCALYCMHRSVEANYKAQRSLFMAHIEFVKICAGIKDEDASKP